MCIYSASDKTEERTVVNLQHEDKKKARERETATQSCSQLQMMKDLMCYVMNCSNGWKRKGCNESKI